MSKPNDATATTALADVGMIEQADLETILNAWQTATDRLQNTHELLRTEVRRLSDELEQKNVELARQDRLADLGRMASHVAHEVRNSLVPMKLYLSLLRRRVEAEPETSRLVDQVQTGFAELETTVSDLLHFTSDREPQLQPVDLESLVRDLLDSMAPQWQAQQVRVHINCPTGLKAIVDRDMLRRALLNLAMNSLDVLSSGGQLKVNIRHDGNSICLEWSDSGGGFASEHLGRLFEPFFTTKSGGTGLGLAIVERIIHSHAGQIEAFNDDQGHAVFRMRIPRQVQETAA